MSLYTSGRARRSLIDTIAFRLVSQLATVLGYVVLVRGMSKEDFGVLNLLYAFIPVVSTVASLGLEQTLRRYQPEYLQAGDDAAANWLVRFIASARFGANVILLALILLAWNQVAPLFKLTAYRAEFAVLCLLILFHFQARVLEIALAGRMMQRLSVGSTALVAIIKLVTYTLLELRGALTLDRVLVADTLARGPLVAYRWYCGSEATAETHTPVPAERRRLLRYGALNNFNDAGTLFLNSKTDNFFIAAILEPLSVGIYSFYTRLNEMVLGLLPARLFESVVQPMFFATPQNEADRRLPQYFSLLLNLNLMLQWPFLVLSAAYHAEIVQIVFGGKFVEYSWLLPLIFLFGTAIAVDKPVTLVAQYEEKAGVLLFSKIFGAFNIVALLALIPRWGVFGAAAASGSAQVLKYAYIWWRVRERARWVNMWPAILSSLIVWGGVLAACIAVKLLVTDNPLTNLIVGTGLAAVGAAIHVRGPALSTSDRAILSSVLTGREASLLRKLGLLAPVALRASRR